MLRPSIFPVIFCVRTWWITPCISLLSQMHVVHFNSDKYANISMAVDKSDGLAVLGVLIEVRACREGLDQKDQSHKQIVYIKSTSLWYRLGSSTQHLTSSLSTSMGLNTKVSFTLMVISIQIEIMAVETSTLSADFCFVFIQFKLIQNISLADQADLPGWNGS